MLADDASLPDESSSPADAPVAVPAVPSGEPDADGAASPGPPAGRADADRRSAAIARRAIDRRVRAVVEGMSDAFLAIGPDWRITYANREAARLNGTVARALVGADHWEQWPETVGSEVERQYRRVVTERVPVQFEHHYERAGIWHDVRAYPADDGGVAVFYRDITKTKLLELERARQARELADAHEQAMAAETQVRLLVDRVTDYAVFLMDPDGIITRWGRGAERIKRLTPEQAIGQHLSICYPSGDEEAEDGSAIDHLRYAARHGEYIGEGTRIRGDGERFLARVVLTALYRGGQLVGFSKITQDMTGERARQAAIESAMVAAEQASMAKSQFLANTSHEIRTPLNAIMGYAELLELGLAGRLDDEQRRYVGRIQSTSRHLLGLINDVLDLSKIEAGEMRALREPGLVGDVVVSALQLVEPQAQARDLVLTNACRQEGGGVAYRGDPERVRQILVNLLSNAVRFTERGGRVSVTCGTAERAPAEARVPDELRSVPWSFVRVEDTGVGIVPEQLDRIWDAFVQVDATRTRKFGGSGLGLTISRHLARLMGGDITVRSQAGLGSTFTLWLPASDLDELRRGAAATEPVRESAEPERMLVELSARQGVGLAAVADALLTETERVIAMYVARMRADRGTPSAHGQGEAQLEDHAVTFVVDLAQCISLVAEDGPEAAQMLRDGTAIQNLIADRHGHQRALLGWSEAEVRRDYEILREEVHAAIRRHVTRGGEADTERALEVANHMLDRASERSVRAQGEARAGIA